MRDNYEFGPWVELPEGAFLSYDPNANAYRIVTPKPKRELVAGKWYRQPNAEYWRRCIAVEDDGSAWLTAGMYCGDDARRWNASELNLFIDWSTPPRDEAPE